MANITAAFVLYNPTKNFINNLNSVRKQVDYVYIIDNSEKYEETLIREVKLLDNIYYTHNNSNIGIASALNKAAELAINEGYDFLLTMDQDSLVSEDYIGKIVFEFEKNDKIGIIAPFIVHSENPQKPDNLFMEEKTVAMTSGCVIRLSAFKKTGGFFDKLFIDYVDNEFCLRMKMSGYKIYQLNSVNIYHRLGNISQRNLLKWKIFPTNHPPVRLYYRTRNRFFIYKNYKKHFPGYIRADKLLFIKEFIKILLYETKKLNKIRMILKGYIDYRRNKFGKFE